MSQLSERILAAANAFGEVWKDEWLLSLDMGVAGKLTLTEASALAKLLYVLGYRSESRFLLEQWLESEVGDRECEPEDYAFSEDGSELIDLREAFCG